MTVSRKMSFSSIRFIMCILYFFSGVATLIYQIAWQRLLLTTLGIDFQSLTIMLSVIMCGLGIGAIGGGFLADRLPTKLIGMFIFIEFAIAVFGFASPDIINAVINWTSASGLSVSSFLVMILPTMLMGALLPVLVKCLNDAEHNVGRSVSMLYFAFAFGGACGAYVTGFILLSVLDLVGVIACAAMMNLGIAIAAYLLLGRSE